MLSKNQIKWINSFKIKKYRQLHDRFIAEGSKIVLEMINSKFPITNVFATEPFIETNHKVLKSSRAEIVPITKRELKKISLLTTPNEVLAVAEIPTVNEIDPTGKITLMLDGIQDPGNMGTIVRIADWFGIEQIVCSLSCADVYNPKVVQATMGSFARVQIMYADSVETLNQFKDVTSYATCMEGKPISEMNLNKEAFIVLGNEANGISSEVLHACDHKLTIPGSGNMESLNVAVAAGIVCDRFFNNV